MVKMFSKHISKFMGGKFSKLVSKIMVRKFSKHVSKIIVKNFSKLVCNVKEMKIVVISLPDINGKVCVGEFLSLNLRFTKICKNNLHTKILIYMFIWKGQHFHKINPDVNGF